MAHPIIEKEEIPFDKNVNSIQNLVQKKSYKKVKMEKNNNNTNYEKSINRRKVGEGEPTEEITKDPVDEIVHYGGERSTTRS